MTRVLAIPTLSDGISVNTSYEKSAMEKESSENANENTELEISEFEYYETPLTIESLHIVAISVVGLWAIFTHLPHLADAILIAYGSIVPPATSWFAIKSWLPDAIPVALGLWLFLRPWQFQGWIERLKSKPAPAEESAS